MTSKTHISARKSAEDVYEAYLNRNRLVTGGFLVPNWTNDGSGIWHVGGAPENAVIHRIDLESGEASSVLDIARLRAALAKATGHEPPYRGLPFDVFREARDGRIDFLYDGVSWQFDTKTFDLDRAPDLHWGQKMPGAMSRTERLAPKTWLRAVFGGGYIPEERGEALEQLSPNGEWFASVKSDNIVLRSTWDAREQVLTTCGRPYRFWDIESRWIARIQGRLGQMTTRSVDPWSQDSLTLLAYLRDMTGVFKCPESIG